MWYFGCLVFNSGILALSVLTSGILANDVGRSGGWDLRRRR
jgi:hypothetical protein